MARPDVWQKRFLIEKRREQVASMYASGVRLYEIAKRLNVRQAVVSLDVKAIKELWKQSAVRDFDQARGDELAKIDELERNAWAAWQRSRRDAETVNVEESIDAKQSPAAIKPTKRSRKIEGRDGDPAYLREVRECIRLRCEILGLFAPRRVENSGDVGGGVSVNIQTNVQQNTVHVIEETDWYGTGPTNRSITAADDSHTEGIAAPDPGAAVSGEI